METNRQILERVGIPPEELDLVEDHELHTLDKSPAVMKPLGSILACAFLWKQSKQGYDYWAAWQDYLEGVTDVSPGRSEYT